MVEIVEYALVFTIASLFGLFSLPALDSFSSFQGNLSAHEAYSSVQTLVSRAVETGRSSGTVGLVNATISCASGTLNFSSGNVHGNFPVHESCDFGYYLLSGNKTLEFTSSSGTLGLEVT